MTKPYRVIKISYDVKEKDGVVHKGIVDVKVPNKVTFLEEQDYVRTWIYLNLFRKSKVDTMWFGKV
jgi:hypothetical protein